MPRIPPRSHTSRSPSRLLAWTALAFALLATVLYLFHLDEVKLMAGIARRLSDGKQLSAEELLVHYTDFAHREIREPTWDELPSNVVRFYYWANPTHPGPGDVVRWGSDYRGGCGSHTRVVVALLQASGISCRPLLLLNDEGKSIHTVVQAQIDGRWAVSDALFGVVFRRADGRLATVEDLATDTTHFRRQIPPDPNYKSIYDYDNVALLNWRKVPVVLPAIKRMLELTIGPERVAGIVRPSLWMWPRALATAIFALLSACFAIAAIATRRRG